MNCFVFSPSVSTKVVYILLFPFSLLYNLITALRNWGYDSGILKSEKFPVPVIVVGNLSVGGTGKTPMVEYLIRLLSANRKIAVLSRGYKRKSKGYILADANSDSDTIGDEPYQYLNKFKDINVAVSENRCNGIRNLLSLNNAPNLVLLDDAFQHRKLLSDCAIILTSYDKIYTHDYLLPSGSLRESALGANRANIIVVTKCPPNLPTERRMEIIHMLKPKKDQAVFFSTIAYDNYVYGTSRLELKELQNYEVLLITGIANPTPLTSHLEEMNIAFKHLKFKDHHDFSKVDLDRINADFLSFESKKRIILTTEKDYVRLIGRGIDLYHLPIKTVFLDEKEAFENLIINYVEKSTGNS